MTRWRGGTPGTPARKGFALLLVIWGLGAIALLVLSFLTTGRLRLQTAFNLAVAAQAQSIAAAAADRAILPLVERKNAPVDPGASANDGAPRFCALENAAVAVAVEDESGKVDLNFASEELLRAMAAGLPGVEPTQADAIARNIVAFRTPPADGAPAADDGGKPFPPKRAPFQTALELDQVPAVNQTTFRALLPFVTIYARAEGIDPHVAPPALLAALLGMAHRKVAALVAAPFPNGLDRDDPRFPPQFRAAGAHGAYLIHAESLLADGASAVREVLVDLQSGDNAPYAVREIHHGQPRYLGDLRAMEAMRADLGPC